MKDKRLNSFEISKVDDFEKERNIKVLILSVWMWNLGFCCCCCFVGYVMLDGGFREGWGRRRRLNFVHSFPKDDRASVHFGPFVYVDIPTSIWCGKKYGYIIRLNNKLTFRTKLTNGTNNEGVFNNLCWSQDVCDSEWHFQGPRWRFTHLFFLQIFLNFHIGTSC